VRRLWNQTKESAKTPFLLDPQMSPEIYRGCAFPGTAKGIILLRF